jgi:hypothetical protein
VLIDLKRKVVATDPQIDSCAICGNDFELGSVYLVAYNDEGDWMEPMCLTCLEYLNRRKVEEEGRARDNWPARGWPTLEDLRETLERYAEPMFQAGDNRLAAAPDFAAEDEIYESFVVWRMKCLEAPSV